MTISRTPDGGLGFLTDDKARCEAYGGGGTVPRSMLRFPPESRVGAAPLDIRGELQRLDCDRPLAAAPPAPSPPPTLVEFAATAPGVARNMMRVSVSCLPEGLSIGLVFFDHEGPLRAFDFTEFEGPAAPAAGLPLSYLRAAGAGDEADVRLSARGTKPEADMFLLALETPSATARARLVAVLRVLAAPGAALTWHQASAEPGRTPARVTARPEPDDAADLARLLAHCGG